MKTVAAVAYVPLLSLQAYFVAHIPHEQFLKRMPPSRPSRPSPPSPPMFTSVSFPVSSSIPTSVALGDADGDGDLDVLVGNVGANELLLNRGDGNFTKVEGFPGGAAVTYSVAFGDVDGDGDLDVLILGVERLILINNIVGANATDTIYDCGFPNLPGLNELHPVVSVYHTV